MTTRRAETRRRATYSRVYELVRCVSKTTVISNWGTSKDEWTADGRVSFFEKAMPVAMERCQERNSVICLVIAHRKLAARPNRKTKQE